MNNLALVQRLVSESGTMSGVAVTTVVGQSGRQLKAVNWIAQSYIDLQNRHTNWKWLYGEFSGQALTPNTARYTGASFNLTRFRRWHTGEEEIYCLYDPAIGVSDEQPLTEISWEYWRRSYGRGTQTANRPTEFAISPSGELCFGPIPDKAYVVQGEYYKSSQVLAANTDTPEMPEDHHMMIVWEALLTLDEHDEASVGKAQRRRLDAIRALENDQLPTIVIGGGALA